MGKHKLPEENKNQLLGLQSKRLQEFKNLYGFDMSLLNEWSEGDWFPTNRAQFYSTAWDKGELGKKDKNDTTMQGDENEDEETFISPIMVEKCHQELVKRFAKKMSKVTYCFKMRVH